MKEVKRIREVSKIKQIDYLQSRLNKLYENSLNNFDQAEESHEYEVKYSDVIFYRECISILKEYSHIIALQSTAEMSSIIEDMWAKDAPTILYISDEDKVEVSSIIRTALSSTNYKIVCHTDHNTLENNVTRAGNIIKKGMFE